MGRTRTGSYNQHIEIQSLIIGQDTEGGITKEWKKFTTAFASKNNLSGNERKATTHGGQVAVSRTEFKLPYQPNITAAMRVVHNGQYFNIKHVNNVYEANEELILDCETGANLG